MKNVIFDLMVSQPIEGSKFHGGGEYAKTVFKELIDHYLDQMKLTVFFNPDLYLDDWILEILEKKNVDVLKVKNYKQVSQSDSFQNADTFVACLLAGIDKVDIPLNMKVIGVYHGFRALEKPIDNTSFFYENTIKGKIKILIKYCGQKKYYNHKYQELNKKIKVCTDIIGVSEHSKYAAQVFFPDFPRDHIHTFYSPEKFVKRIDGIDEVKSEKTILMLGGNRWIKNLYRGVLALDQLFSAKFLNEYTVKIVGGIPNGIIKKIKNKKHFVSIEYLPPEELEKIYKSCEIFFYPSLNEGFGYPPEEVMKYGKTCVISSVNSLPEIYKDSVYYCNPYDINEMQGRILQAIEMKIPTNVIEKNYKRIANRQKEDLSKLCELILE